MGTPWRALTMRLAGDERSFQVLVYDGCCADGLQKAVAARVAASADAIYCTFTPEANGPVLPLSPALVSQVSDSQVLTIHISRPSLLPPVVEPPQATSTSSNLRQSEDALSSPSPMDAAVSSPTMQPLRKINSAGVLQNAGNSYARSMGLVIYGCLACAGRLSRSKLISWSLPWKDLTVSQQILQTNEHCWRGCELQWQASAPSLCFMPWMESTNFGRPVSQQVKC